MTTAASTPSASDPFRQDARTIGLIGLAPSTEDLAKLGREPVLADYELTVNYGPAE